MTEVLSAHQLTADGQILWRGTVLGSGSPYGWVNLAGWLDLPSQRGSNSPIPNRHGSYPGRKLSGDRVITFDWKSKRVDAEGFRVAMAALRRITAPDEDPQEEPLVVRLDGESWMTWARCIERIIPTDKHYAVGRTAGALRWEATDPRLYSVSEERVIATLPAPAVDGLGFPLDFSGGGLDFGPGRSGGLVRALNRGDVPTWPILEFPGPVTGPVATFPGSRSLRFHPEFSVLAGQTLVVDTKPGVRTVELNGVSARSNLLTRQWTPLLPDEDTEIRFSAATYNPDARMVVRWRHATQ